MFTVSYYTCDMERDGQSSGNCRIRQERGADTFDWSQGQGRTPSAGVYDRRIDNLRFPVTGPQNARQGTYYIYTEASQRRAGDTAR